MAASLSARTVELFTWEKLDTVDDVRRTFGIG